MNSPILKIAGRVFLLSIRIWLSIMVIFVGLVLYFTPESFRILEGDEAAILVALPLATSPLAFVLFLVILFAKGNLRAYAGTTQFLFIMFFAVIVIGGLGLLAAEIETALFYCTFFSVVISILLHIRILSSSFYSIQNIITNQITEA